MKNKFTELLKQKKVILLDGAAGTEMMKLGMPSGACPEKWAFDNRDKIIKMHQSYINVGTDIIYTATLGGSKIKLEEHGISADNTYTINKSLAEVAVKAAGDNALVAGDIGPTGRSVFRMDLEEFNEVIDSYKVQIEGLRDGGVSVLIIETMMDIQEARAAVIAAKEVCDLPIMVSMTYEQNERTLTGTTPETAAITLESLGVAAIGVNCSLGPDLMEPIVQRYMQSTKIPVFAKPNAGLPRLEDGKTIFDMQPEEFSEKTKKLACMGAKMIGGCCGTAPDYIECLYKKLQNIEIPHVEQHKLYAISSFSNYLKLNGNDEVHIIGERINPTGKKKLSAEFLLGKTDIAVEYALKQKEVGAHILDINVGVTGIDEKSMLPKTVRAVFNEVQLPLCIDSSSPEAVEQALRIYPGRALINSISLEKIKIDKLLPVAAKYGAALLLLPLDDNGIPSTLEEVQTVVLDLYKEIKKYGYEKEDVIIDAICMSASADIQAPNRVLQTIKWITHEFKTGTVIGLSNISFGLPERKHVNNAFLSMAVANGLSACIMNPESENAINMLYASQILNGRKGSTDNYIKIFTQGMEVSEDGKPEIESRFDQIFKFGVKGRKADLVKAINEFLAQGISTNELIENALVPAVIEAGRLFDKGIYYLPQLILSSSAIKAGMDIIKSLDSNKELNYVGTVIMATVKGDIHDIGKNIVSLMLENNGFKVVDLGTDVDSERIVNTAVKEKADIIGLSALMTTTAKNMEDVILLVKEKGVDSKVIVGGACITSNYAEKIGADGYSENAVDAVKLSLKLMKN